MRSLKDGNPVKLARWVCSNKKCRSVDWERRGGKRYCRKCGAHRD